MALQRLMSPQKQPNFYRLDRYQVQHQQNKSVIGRPTRQLTSGSDESMIGSANINEINAARQEPKTPELNHKSNLNPISSDIGATNNTVTSSQTANPQKMKQNSIYYLIQQAKKINSPTTSSNTQDTKQGNSGSNY